MITFLTKLFNKLTYWLGIYRCYKVRITEDPKQIGNKWSYPIEVVDIVLYIFYIPVRKKSMNTEEFIKFITKN